jgi:hypothetical protein
MAAVLAGCGAEAPSTPAPSSSPLAAVSSEPLDAIGAEIDDQIVRAMERAFAEGDRDLLPPTEGMDDRARESLFLAVDRSRDFAPDRLVLKTGSADRKRVDQSRYLRGTYRLKGIPADLPFTVTIFVEPRGPDGWRLSRLDWDFAAPWVVKKPVRRTMTPAALIFHPPGFDAAGLGDMVAEARVNLGKSLPDVRSKTYLVLVPQDKSDFSRAGGNGSASVGTMGTVLGREFEYSEPWLLVNPADWDDLDAAGRHSLVLHEVTHAMLTPITSPLVPNWVSEGIAVHYSGDPGLQVILRDPGLLEEESLMAIAGRLFPTMSHADYAISGAAFSHLTERFGEAAVLDFLESFAAEQTDQEVEHLERAFVRHLAVRDQGQKIAERLLEKRFGMTLEQLDGAAKDRIRTQI